MIFFTLCRNNSNILPLSIFQCHSLFFLSFLWFSIHPYKLWLLSNIVLLHHFTMIWSVHHYCYLLPISLAFHVCHFTTVSSIIYCFSTWSFCLLSFTFPSCVVFCVVTFVFASGRPFTLLYTCLFFFLFLLSMFTSLFLCRPTRALPRLPLLTAVTLTFRRRSSTPNTCPVEWASSRPVGLVTGAPRQHSTVDC